MHERWWTLMLYFENWVLLLSVFYFSLSFLLTTFAVCTEGAESSSTPLVVWIVWAAYGALLPAALLNSLMFVFVTTRYSVTGLSNVTGTERVFDIAGNYATVTIVLLDAWINRQPYYATYHGFIGCLTSWGYLAFNITYVLTGGTNEAGQPYIYRAFNWLTPHMERHVSAGRLVLLECFCILPLFNALYWCMLWARRRARVAAKHSTA